MGTFSNARTEAMVTAGARPIHVWEAHSCSALVPIFLIIVAYLLTIPWSFFFFFSCSQSILIKRQQQKAYYRETNEHYTEYKFKYRMEKRYFPEEQVDD